MNYMSAEHYMRLFECFLFNGGHCSSIFSPLQQKKIKKILSEYINNKIISIPLQTFFDY